MKFNFLLFPFVLNSLNIENFANGIATLILKELYLVTVLDRGVRGQLVRATLTDEDLI
jgi:hypothetical protein